MKRSDERIEVVCMICRVTDAVISGWAGRPMEPARITED
jgi:hypothetical protein